MNTEAKKKKTMKYFSIIIELIIIIIMLSVKQCSSDLFIEKSASNENIDHSIHFALAPENTSKIKLFLSAKL